MIRRITTNWTLIRVVYLLLGGIIAFQSGMQGEWLGMSFGIYFAAMGLFGFGCAGGACGYIAPRNTNRATNLQYEEIKEVKS